MISLALLLLNKADQAVKGHSRRICGPGGQGPFTYTYTTNGAQGFDFGGGFSDPFEIFEQFFGGASPFGRTQRRTTYQLTISLWRR